MRSLQRTVLALTLVFLATGVAQAAPRVRDVWHSYVAEGKRYGYIHTVVARLPDGNFRIIRESRLLIDLLGANKEEITERGEFVVTPDYRPVSIAVEGKQQSGAVRVIGRIRGTSFEVTATVAGVERSWVYDRPEAILPEPCLDDWLADRPPGFRAGEVTLLGERSCMPKPAKVERLGSRPGETGVSWAVDAGPLDGNQRLVLDAEGVCLERSAAGGLSTIRRSSAEQARDIAYRKMNGPDVLMFPIGKEVGPPELLESLTVELKWKDIDFERFRLEDDRQHLVERSHEGNQYRAVVRIEAPKPLTSSARLPIAGPEFARYLGESRYIKPHDERIIAVAREVTRGKTDALGGRQGPERMDVDQRRGIAHRRDAHRAGGARVPEGEVQRVRDLVRLAGAGRRHTHADRTRRADDPGLLGGAHVERGLRRPVDPGRLERRRGRDVVRPGEADRPRDCRGDAAPSSCVAGELRDRDQGSPLEVLFPGGQIQDGNRRTQSTPTPSSAAA